MTTERITILAPKPEVQHLPTLFRRIQTGEIRVPTFQREFAWDESQIISLLDSVYRGYPIGSLLLWEVSESVFREETEADLPFPQTSPSYPTRFLLDGLQRLASLYGVFHRASANANPLFSVLFSLRDQTFRHAGDEPMREDEIPLAAMFSPKELLEHQKRLYALGDAELLIERTLALQSVFQEYMIPTVTISHRNVAEVVEIFRRINSTGTPLGAVDFMRALTWSGDFDLNQQLQRIVGRLGKRNVKPSDETILKSLATVVGVDPSAPAMLQMRNIPAQQLLEAVERTEHALNASLDFLHEVFLLQSSDFLPYEGQLLALVKYFSAEDTGDPANKAELAKWLWTTSLNEELRGKPDHYVSRLLRIIDELRKGQINQLPRRLQISPEQWIDRRMIRGKALSAAYAAMFAKNEARSLFTGDVCPPEGYLRAYDVNSFAPIFDLATLRRAHEHKLPSARTFANLVLIGPEDIPSVTLDLNAVIGNLIERIGEAPAYAAFKSQFFSRDGLERYLADGDERALLKSRADELSMAARFLTGG